MLETPTNRQAAFMTDSEVLRDLHRHVCGDPDSDRPGLLTRMDRAERTIKAILWTAAGFAGAVISTAAPKLVSVVAKLLAVVVVVSLIAACETAPPHPLAQPAPLSPPAAPMVAGAGDSIQHAIEANNETAAALARGDATAAAQYAAQVQRFLATAARYLSQALAAVEAKDAEASTLHAQAQQSAGIAAKAAADLQRMTADRDDWKTRYKTSWLGGRFYFWFWTALSLATFAGVALFVAEWFFGLNIHPLSWLLSAGKFLAAGLIRAATSIVRLFRTGAPAPAPTPAPAPPSTDPAPPGPISRVPPKP